MATQIQKTVLFYGDELIAIQEIESGAIFVPLNRLCDNLGIARNRQVQRIRDHPVLSRGYTALDVETGGGRQETQCLRLDLIPLWLAGINANRVASAVQAKLVQYQAEAAQVLWAAFRPDILPSDDPALALGGASGAALAYEIATAIQHLARQQMELEQRLGGRIDQMARWARDFGQTVDHRLALVDHRLGTLELQVSPQAAVSEQQAAEIALAVKNVGHALADKGTRAGYGQVYSEMYRRYGISSYKNLPQDKFAEVLQWLHSWHADLTSRGGDETAS
ncbi:MAG: phage antirepressor N-terminal domain-containing protein [Actinomycetota bacterium]|nr:phage antirepressor N-terminal domain-containing protein [Actinomycetota bacterium]